jgi:hypothetical protein
MPERALAHAGHPILAKPGHGGFQTGNQKAHKRRNLPNQPTQLDTIEIEPSKQNATKAVAFSFFGLAGLLTFRSWAYPKRGSMVPLLHAFLSSSFLGWDKWARGSLPWQTYTVLSSARISQSW